MAEYKDMCEGISKILECGICMSQLHKPKVLHCQHSFCKDCIDNILKFSPDGSAVVICPFRCAGNTIIPADQTVGQLGVNYQLQGIVEMYKEKSDEPQSTSGGYCCHTDDDVASIYCNECNNFYCGKCERGHQNHLSTKITYSDAYGHYFPVCKEHDALGNFVCCKQIICVYCQNRKHKGHQFENLNSHASRIKQLFFNPDGSVKIDKVMQNAKSNYDSTVVTLTGMKKSLVETLKSRMLTSISEHISLVEKEAVRLVEQLDKEICKQMESYPNVAPSDFLKTVVEKDDVELVVKRELILTEYAKYTTRVPTLNVGLTDGAESPKEFPLGNLKVDYGNFIPIGSDENIPSVNNRLPQSSGIFDVPAVVNKLENLMKEANLKAGKLSTDMPRYSETKEFINKGKLTAVQPPLQQALSMLDLKGYDFIDELCVQRKEQLLIDIVVKRKEVANMKDNTGVTVLHSAAQYGFDKLLAYLLNSNLVDVNMPQKFKQTALHYAAYHNKVGCVKLLLSHNADPTLRNHKGSRPIDVANQYKSVEVLPLLQQIDN